MFSLQVAFKTHYTPTKIILYQSELKNRGLGALMHKLNLLNKLLILTLVPVTLIIVLLTTAYYTVESDNLKSDVAEFRRSLIEQRSTQLKELSEVALGIIAYEKSLPNGGDIDSALRKIRFGSSGYFFIYDTSGVNIFHAAKPQLQGKNLIDFKDVKGKKVIAGLIDVAKNGDGIDYFYWPKPGLDEEVEKLGYSVLIPGTDWVLGTGAYIDDINATVKEYEAFEAKVLSGKTFYTLLASLALILITAVIVFFAAAKMVKPIQRMADNLNDIAQGEGDLTLRLAVSGHDEIAQLGTSFNLFVEKLRCIICDIHSATVSINDSGKAISEQNHNIGEQLASHNDETDQVVSAITEMSATANEVAGNTNHVAEATQAVTSDVMSAQERVQDSLTEVSALVEEINGAASCMDSLSEQSQKINNVLTVIGSIAEQTNLLALNAAIEAARAGEQGRGFAVVADEVRNLASRTQESTLEINEMLEELHRLVTQSVNAMSLSQERSGRTVESSQAISESLISVTGAITSINDMATQIATATTEQSSVTEEVNRNVNEIQRIVTLLTDSSNEAETVSKDVLAEGDKLNQLVGQFKV